MKNQHHGLVAPALGDPVKLETLAVLNKMFRSFSKIYIRFLYDLKTIYLKHIGFFNTQRTICWVVSQKKKHGVVWIITFLVRADADLWHPWNIKTGDNCLFTS